MTETTTPAIFHRTATTPEGHQLTVLGPLDGTDLYGLWDSEGAGDGEYLLTSTDFRDPLDLMLELAC
jgi:hypothetical protein